MCQNRPLSVPPLSKKGSTMIGQASLTTRDGGGRPAPGCEQATSQNRRKPASTTSGGRTIAATLARPLPEILGRLRAFTGAASRPPVPRLTFPSRVVGEAIMQPS
ncbi:hypothetical protein AEGHOMDF_0224 [Methylobacterium soli]|nr:hypothetical protein AEGHOMDF_0224 [Methylobacterium soli]